jgi:hypothetical protein
MTNDPTHTGDAARFVTAARKLNVRIVSVGFDTRLCAAVCWRP